MQLFFLVRAWGLEPQRITAREPKGDVTLVKGFLVVSGNKQFVFGVVLRIIVNLLLHSNHNCRQFIYKNYGRHMVCQPEFSIGAQNTERLDFLYDGPEQHKAVVKNIVFELLLGAEYGVAVQSALAQRLVAVKQCTVEHVRDIEENQIVGQGQSILRRDLIADDEFVIDQLGELGRVIAGNGDDGRALFVANVDGLIELAREERGRDDQNEVLLADAAREDAQVARRLHGLCVQPDHAETKFQILRHKAGIGRRKDIDMRGFAHGGGGALDKLLVQHGGCVDQHIAIIAADRADQTV